MVIDSGVVKYGKVGFRWELTIAYHSPILALPTAKQIYVYMDVSENSGTPKSSISKGFSIINHPFWGTSIFGNTHMYIVSDCFHGFTFQGVPA